MKPVHRATVAAAAVLAVSGGGAIAAPKCNIVGTWTDDHGTTLKFTSEKSGRLTNGSLCPAAYKVKVTTLTRLVIDVTVSTKDTKCPTPFSVGGAFQDGGCTSIEGSITLAGVGTLSDTFTKQASTAKPAESPALEAGLR
jgi:hypothetical protein